MIVLYINRAIRILQTFGKGAYISPVKSLYAN